MSLKVGVIETCTQKVNNNIESLANIRPAFKGGSDTVEIAGKTLKQNKGKLASYFAGLLSVLGIKYVSRAEKARIEAEENAKLEAEKKEAEAVARAEREAYVNAVNARIRELETNNPGLVIQYVVPYCRENTSNPYYAEILYNYKGKPYESYPVNRRLTSKLEILRDFEENVISNGKCENTIKTIFADDMRRPRDTKTYSNVPFYEKHPLVRELAKKGVTVYPAGQYTDRAKNVLHFDIKDCRYPFTLNVYDAKNFNMFEMADILNMLADGKKVNYASIKEIHPAAGKKECYTAEVNPFNN